VGGSAASAERRLLAAGGVDALTMRGLAQECGVQGPALYWHFKDKTELLGLIVDSVMDDLETGRDGQPWDDRMLASGRSLRRLMVTHPGLAIVAAGRYTMPDTVKGALDEILGFLVEAGFTHRQALAVLYSFLSFTTGFAIYETTSPFFHLNATPVDSAERRFGRAELAAMVDERHPYLGRAVEETVDLTVDELFEQALVAIVAGWSTQLSGPTRRRRGATRR
jgi:TetR/AcrR family tetracycline transcriptional repressor